MKKTLLAAAAVAALTTSAFAEATIGAWLRTVVAPVAYNGDDVVGIMENSWGGVRLSRFDINMVSEDEKAGVVTGVYWDNGNAGMSDASMLWLKPVDMLKLSAGKFDNNTLRGDLCYGSWDWIRPTWIGDEGLTFSGRGGTGLIAEVTPMDALYIQGYIPVNQEAAKAEDIYGKASLAMKFDIENIGRVKAGWFGQYSRTSTMMDAATSAAPVKEYEFDTTTGKAKEKENKTTYEVAGSANYYYGDIEAAFDLTAVENLYVTIGGKVAMMDSDYVGERAKIGLGVSYNIADKCKVSANGKVSIANTGADSDKVSFNAGAGVGVNVAEGLSVIADFRINKQGGVDDPSIGFMAGADYSCSSNASVGIGFQGTVKGALNGIAAKDDFCFAVPVKLQVSF